VSVEFEPVKLGPRRRRLDPLAIGAALVALGLIAAVLKPWSAQTEPASGAPDAALVSRAPSPGAPATPAASQSVATPPPTPPTSTAALASWDRVRPAVAAHESWGIRAIVARPAGLLGPAGDLRFDEVWNPLTDLAGGTPTVDIEPDDETVVAVGITFPPAHTPLDVRIWLVRRNGFDWVDTRPVDTDPAGGAFLYRVGGEGPTFRNWQAGRYSVDVLVDGGIRRFGFTLPNRFEIVPTDPAPRASPADLVDPDSTDLGGLPIGPFVTARGVAVPLRERSGPPMTETDAWLDLDPGTLGAPRPRVAAAYLPAATGLGVKLAKGSVVRSATIQRLAPAASQLNPALVLDVFDPGHPNSTVLFRALDGRAWSPGTYELSVGWLGRVGVHQESWLIELQPGPARAIAPMLQAARRFARFAGQAGVVTGTAEPLEGGPRAVAIRLTQARPSSGPSIPARDRVPCDGMTVDALTSIIGLAGPFATPPVRVSARALFEFIRSDELPILVAAGDVPGIVLVAPAGNAGATSDVFRRRLADSSVPATGPVCLNTTPAG
jgi:hypothetical protein